MADEKPSGGGSKWGPFEIILVILFGVALISKLQGEDFKPLAVPDDTKEESLSKKTTQAPCGLTVTQPRPLEKVEGYVTLAGTTVGCSWGYNESPTLYAQVVDARNVPMSANTVVKTGTPNEAGDVAFSATIELTNTPGTNTGYLVLLPGDSAALGEKQNTSRVPIQFSR